MARILVRGGRVLNPAADLDQVADVLLDDGRIREVGLELEDKMLQHMVSYVGKDGLYWMPGDHPDKAYHRLYHPNY